MKATTPAKEKTPKRQLKCPTWEHPKGSGIMIAEVPNKNGGKVFGVSYRIRVPGKLLGQANRREQLQRSTKAAAERLAEDRFIALRKHGTEFSKIPADAQKKAALAWSILEEHNRTAAAPVDFIECVKAGLRVLAPAGGSKTVADAVAELVASKQERRDGGTLDESTFHDFKVRAEKFAGAFEQRPIGEVLHTEIAEWLKKLRKNGAQFGGPLAARSVRNYRNTIAEVFRHATARQYCTENPFARFTREDLKGLGGANDERDLDGINVLSVEETRRLLKAAADSGEKDILATAVLRLFCGIRTTEACKLDWSEVHWLDAKPYVHIPAGKAKKRRIRQVSIPENAVAWLKQCNPPASGPLVPSKEKDARKVVKLYCVRFGRIAKAAGIVRQTEHGTTELDWENNDARHSFGSYHFALHGNALETALQMGHRQNDDMLFSHYRELVRKEDAAAFFGIVPEVEAGKVTPFPQAATA